MELTGENKEQFEKWLFTQEYSVTRMIRLALSDFYEWIPFEMKIGVYLAYYDSLDIHICIETSYLNQDDSLEFLYTVEYNRVGSGTFTESRNEAYKEAFKKADEIVNKKH